MTSAGRMCALACLGTVLSAGACESDMTVPEFVDGAFDTICDFNVRCGQSADAASCHAAIPRDEADQIDALVKAGKVVFDAKAAEDCLAAYRTKLSSCSISKAVSDGDELACVRAFRGTSPGGAACANDLECVSGECERIVCSGDIACCPGTCRAGTITFAEVGDDCSQAGTFCPDGAFCNRTSNLCQIKAALDQDCDQFEGCAEGTVCSFAAGSGGTPLRGTCIHLAGEGEACGQNALTCDDLTDACDATLHCAPRVPVGGSCAAGASCVGFARCDGATGTCVARKGVGGSCTGFGDCGDNLSCSPGGTCQVRSAPVCE